MTLGITGFAASGDRVAIADVTPGGLNISSILVNLEHNGTAGEPECPQNLENGTAHIAFWAPLWDNFTIRWTDDDADGRRSVGDFFTIGHVGVFPIGEFRFPLIYCTEGSVLATVDFSVPCAAERCDGRSSRPGLVVSRPCAAAPSEVVSAHRRSASRAHVHAFVYRIPAIVTSRPIDGQRPELLDGLGLHVRLIARIEERLLRDVDRSGWRCRNGLARHEADEERPKPNDDEGELENQAAGDVEEDNRQGEQDDSCDDETQLHWISLRTCGTERGAHQSLRGMPRSTSKCAWGREDRHEVERRHGSLAGFSTTDVG